MSIASANPRLHGKRHLPALTSLRIFAAMHVVLFHCAFYMMRHTAWRYMAATRHLAAPLHWGTVVVGDAIINIIAAGGWSVSFFFVLSGFILFYNYGEDRTESFNSKKFWIARFARIYPVYVLGMAVIWPFMFRGRWGDPEMLNHNFLAGGTLSLSLLQSWFWRYATFWNAPGWSMSTEAFFYALFPLLLFPLRKVSSATKLLAIIFTCWIFSMVKGPIIWAFMRHSWVAAGGQDDPGAIMAITDYNPLARLPEFLAGMALGRLMLIRGGPALSGAKLSILTFLTAFIGLSIAALGPECPSFLAAAGGLTPIFALLIWFLSAETSLPARLLAWSPLVFFGEASYSVYILHVPLEHWFGWAIHRIWHFPDAPIVLDIPTYGFLMLFMPMLLCICGLVYFFFELPARDFIRRGFRRRAKTPAQIPSAEIAVTPG